MRLVIALTDLLIESLLGYCKEIISIVQNSGLPELQNSQPFNRVIELYTGMLDGYKKGKKNPLTRKLYEKDKMRDNFYRGIKHLVRGYLLSGTYEEVTSAKKVMAILEKYGLKMLQNSYISQNAELRKLLEELQVKTLAADLETLSMTEKVARLEQLQSDFESIYAECITDRANFRAKESATAYKQKLIKAVRLLMNYVNILKFSGSTPQIEDICQKIEAFNEKFSQTEKRKKRSKKSSAENDTSEPPKI